MMTKIFPDGIIDPGDDSARELGFLPELFEGYLFCENFDIGRRIIISYIESRTPGQGAFKKLVENIEAAGYKVSVPTPLPLMEAVLTKWGFESHIEHDDVTGEDYAIWERPGTCEHKWMTDENGEWCVRCYLRRDE